VDEIQCLIDKTSTVDLSAFSDVTWFAIFCA
jgi:hypothetical protein